MYDSGDWAILILKVDGGFDDIVNVERRTAIGAAIMMNDVFYFIFFGVDFAPGGFIGEGSSCA